MAVIGATVLGCGSSGGVPRTDGDWGACDANEIKNQRLRCSLLIERAKSKTALADGRATRLLIDTAPDLRVQLLRLGAPALDALAYTHDHADQSHGIDDLRAGVYRRGSRLPAFMLPKTRQSLTERFGYIFKTPPGSGYPPLLEARDLTAGEPTVVEGEGGALTFAAFEVEHGSIRAAGFRIGPIAYTPDVSAMPEAAFAAIEGVSVWIVDALRYRSHPSHAHFDLALAWLERARPALGVLTNLHIDMDYQTLLTRCPANVRPAYDGLRLIADEADGAIVSVGPP